MASLVKEILARNGRVEIDKAWEQSKTRRLAISALTYLTLLPLMFLMGVERPFFSALIPVAGFLLSTLTLGGLKKIWVSKRASRQS